MTIHRRSNRGAPFATPSPDLENQTERTGTSSSPERALTRDTPEASWTNPPKLLKLVIMAFPEGRI